MKSAFVLIASQPAVGGGSGGGALFNFPMIYNKPLFNNTQKAPKVFIKNPQRLIQLGRASGSSIPYIVPRRPLRFSPTPSSRCVYINCIYRTAYKLD
jgi:hypothetical protein